MSTMLNIRATVGNRAPRPDWLPPAVPFHAPARPRIAHRPAFRWAGRNQGVGDLCILPHHDGHHAMVRTMIADPSNDSGCCWSYLLIEPADLPALYTAWAADPEGTLCVWFHEADTVRALMRVKPAAAPTDLFAPAEAA